MVLNCTFLSIHLNTFRYVLFDSENSNKYFKISMTVITDITIINVQMIDIWMFLYDLQQMNKLMIIRSQKHYYNTKSLN